MSGRWSRYFAAFAFASGSALIAVFLVRRRNNKRFLQQPALLAQLLKHDDNIVVGNAQQLEEKIRCLVAGGTECLQVVADFDRTITSAWRVDSKTGEKQHNPSCHGILERCPVFSEKYRRSGRLLYDTYHPLEISDELSQEQKTQAVVDWYTKGHENLLQEKFNDKLFEQAVKSNPTKLRKGAKSLINQVEALQIPFLVFSAGLANIIKQVFVSEGVATQPTTHIISNQIVFDASGSPRFDGPLIHVFNKDSRHVGGSDYALAVSTRPNAILLGDSVGDVHMADGLNSKVVVKVGFLNFNKETALEQYKKLFDIVVLDDGSMEVVSRLIDLVNES